MTRVLHVLHGDELHEMPHVQAVCRGIEPDIKGRAFFGELFVKLLFVYRLLDKSPLAQGVHNVLHNRTPEYNKKVCVYAQTENTIVSRIIHP